jgi:hypothetical protein
VYVIPDERVTSTDDPRSDVVFEVDCQGNPPGTEWLALRMTPSDATAFIKEHGCGRRRQTVHMRADCVTLA